MRRDPIGASRIEERPGQAAAVTRRELSLGVWLVIKGFKPSPITAAMTAADSAPAYHDVTA
jgi:hypothetical protein